MAKEETTATPIAPTEVIEDIDQKKLDQSQELIKKYMWWSMGAGLIPVPLVDMATVAGVQLKMLNELSKVYGVKFSKNAGKSIISVLVGSLSAEALSKSHLQV